MSEGAVLFYALKYYLSVISHNVNRALDSMYQGNSADSRFEI